MVSQERHSAQLLQVELDEAPAGDSSRDQAHGGPIDADSTERFGKVPRLGRDGAERGGDVESKGPLYKLGEHVWDGGRDDDRAHIREEGSGRRYAERSVWFPIPGPADEGPGIGACSSWSHVWDLSNRPPRRMCPGALAEGFERGRSPSRFTRALEPRRAWSAADAERFP
jgi:hypothetical protein